MFRSTLTELTGTEFPIIGGAMMDLSKAPLVTAIAKAGGLGLIASAIYQDEGEFRDDLKAVKDGTGNPFGVNINLFPMMRKLDNMRYLEIMAEEQVRIVETSGSPPPRDLVTRMQELEMLWMHKCVGVRHAKHAERLGANAVTVVGYENGGATGNLDITTQVLVPSTVKALQIPVVAGGGVVDGRTLLAALALGAAGVIMGTRILLSEECPIHDNLKQALLQASELDTAVIMRQVGFAHRVWLNDPAKKVIEIETGRREVSIKDLYPYVAGEAARKMYVEGALHAGTVSCSQAVGLIDEIKPIREIFSEMIADAERIHAEMLA